MSCKEGIVIVVQQSRDVNLWHAELRQQFVGLSALFYPEENFVYQNKILCFFGQVSPVSACVQLLTQIVIYFLEIRIFSYLLSQFFCCEWYFIVLDDFESQRLHLIFKPFVFRKGSVHDLLRLQLWSKQGFCFSVHDCRWISVILYIVMFGSLTSQPVFYGSSGTLQPNVFLEPLTDR